MHGQTDERLKTAYWCVDCALWRYSQALILVNCSAQLTSSRLLWVLLQVGKAASLVQDMVKGGLRPDQFTFTAILNACQRANEAEVAFEVFR